jgi:hypothetical protein
LFLNRLELLAPPFVSRQKDGKRKKQPLRKRQKKESRHLITVVGENTNNGVESNALSLLAGRTCREEFKRKVRKASRKESQRCP